MRNLFSNATQVLVFWVAQSLCHSLSQLKSVSLTVDTTLTAERRGMMPQPKVEIFRPNSWKTDFSKDKEWPQRLALWSLCRVAFFAFAKICFFMDCLHPKRQGAGMMPQPKVEMSRANGWKPDFSEDKEWHCQTFPHVADCTFLKKKS